MSRKLIKLDRFTDTPYERSVKVARYQHGRLRHVRRWVIARLAGKKYPMTKGVRMLLRIHGENILHFLRLA